MKSKPAARARRPKAPPREDQPTPPLRSLKPRRKLFVALVALFVLWVAALVVMYFTTVYPDRATRIEAPLEAPAE